MTTLVEEELTVEAVEADVMMAVDAALSSKMLSSHQQKSTTKAVDAVLSLNLLFKKNPLDIDEEEEERRLLSLPSSSSFSSFYASAGCEDDEDDDQDPEEEKPSVSRKKAARASKSLIQTVSDKPPDFVVKLYSMFSVRASNFGTNVTSSPPLRRSLVPNSSNGNQEKFPSPARRIDLLRSFLNIFGTASSRLFRDS